MNAARLGVLVLIAATTAAANAEAQSTPDIGLTSMTPSPAANGADFRAAPALSTRTPAGASHQSRATRSPVAEARRAAPHGHGPAYTCSIAGLIAFGIFMVAARAVAREARHNHRRHVATHAARRRSGSTSSAPEAFSCNTCRAGGEVTPLPTEVPDSAASDEMLGSPALLVMLRPANRAGHKNRRQAA